MHAFFFLNYYNPLIFFIEKANDKVTAKGKPSGIVKTIIVIHKIIISTIFLATIALGGVKLLLVCPEILSSIFLSGKLNKKKSYNLYLIYQN